MTKKTIYRISFTAQNNVYEVYAKSVAQGDIFGFIQIENITFGETSSVVVDPSEEHLKTEFQGVKKSYIPLHSVLRIDVVEKEGTGKITVLAKDGSNITQFPKNIYSMPQKTD